MFLGPGQMRALVAAGDEIGDHSVRHFSLTSAASKGLTYEIDAAAATIASVTGRWPETLAYPIGRTNARVEAAVAACTPLRMAVVEGGGGTEIWANRFHVGRLRVTPYELPATLLAEVERVAR
jgi:peptidoglycan/xylan/chitin deacetylase (PgdA/CDA1 family)